MMLAFWRRLRQLIIRLAFRDPRGMSALVFLFLFVVSNHVYSGAKSLQDFTFWHMLMMGTLMATFGAVLLYEVIRTQRNLAEVRMVRTVTSTLQHEINNSLNVIQLSAGKLQALKSYDESSVRNILTYSSRIHDVVTKLSQLEERVLFHQDPGFAGVIDVARSR